MARTIAGDHDAKRLRILDTAAPIFAEQGVTRASMARLAKACGMSKATIYHYYDSKDALLFDILDRFLSAIRERIGWLQLEALPPEDALRMIVEEILLGLEGTDAEQRILAEAAILLPHNQYAILLGYERDILAQISAALSRCAPDVFGVDPVSLRGTSMSVYAMLTRFTLWNPNADRPARVAYASLVSRLTLGGLHAI